MTTQPASSVPGYTPTSASRQVSDRSWNVARTVLPGLGMLAMVLGSQPVRAANLPPDVAAFVARRDRCDHFRGEDTEDAARHAEITRAQVTNCRGTDAELARLLRRHAGNTAVRDRLGAYDPNVEGAPPRRR